MHTVKDFHRRWTWDLETESFLFSETDLCVCSQADFWGELDDFWLETVAWHVVMVSWNIVQVAQQILADDSSPASPRRPCCCDAKISAETEENLVIYKGARQTRATRSNLVIQFSRANCLSELPMCLTFLYFPMLHDDETQFSHKSNSTRCLACVSWRAERSHLMTPNSSKSKSCFYPDTKRGRTYLCCQAHAPANSALWVSLPAVTGIGQTSILESE